MRYVAIIPAYCPADTLPTTCAELVAYGFDVIVVDDGSPREYGTLFDKASQHACILRQQANGGKGHALKSGMHHVTAHYASEVVMVTLDADGQHAPADALACVQAAEAHGNALILGCRDFSAPGVPAKSRIGNRLTERLFRLCTGTHVSDTQTGLRAFRSSLAPLFMRTAGNRYEYEMNMLLTCVDERIPFVEVAVATIYERGNPTSHFHVLRDSFLIYRQLLSFTASSLIGFGIDYALFSLLVMLLGPQLMLASNVLARLVSATVNYELNRRVVFRRTDNHLQSAEKYAALAAVILALNSALLALLVRLGLNAYLAKVAVELVLFLLSYTVQRRFVFGRGAAGRP